MKSEKRRQILFFVSLIGIIIVLLIMGTTYAYQTLIVEYKKGSDNDMAVSAAKLNVSFEKTNKIELKNMPLLPDYKTADYTEFTIKTNDTSDDIAYSLNLKNIDYGYINNDNDKTRTKGCRTASSDLQAACIISSDFKYTITEVTSEGENYLYTGDFRELNGNEFELNYKNYIEKEKNQTLRLYLWIKETGKDQSILEKTYFEANLEIVSTYKSENNPFSKGTLAYKILDNGATTINEYEEEIIVDPMCEENVGVEQCINIGVYTIELEVKNTNNSKNINIINDISSTSDVNNSNDNGLFITEDDYGTSYYYRGTILNNYVKFAGFTWRIVRINGDGSVRLILNGTLDKVKREGLDNYAGSETIFNLSNNNAYVGYMYGNINATSYDDAHRNTNNSKVKEAIDLFYETYIQNTNSGYNYEKYLSDTLFCGDKTRKLDSLTGGYGTLETNYTGNKSTLKCASSEYDNDTITEDQRAYSRYTAKLDMSETISTGIKVNNDLIHPIGLLSYSELVHAGAYSSKINPYYYLSEAYKNEILINNWWTMTPYGHGGGETTVFLGQKIQPSLNQNSTNFSAGIRPVINLRGNLTVTGIGTEDNPYLIAN